ncbi:MAG: hypothetical protein HRT61_22935 [Ekhidna sp.]|nr:hypothetical protein [Ekhidna sp.]
MNYWKLDKEILSSVQNLNGRQQIDLLRYIKNIKLNERKPNSYRRRAMKEIREALQHA